MNPKKLIIIAFLLVLPLNHAYGDEVYTYLYVRCEPSKKMMLVVPKPELNNRRSPEEHGPVSIETGKDREFIVSDLLGTGRRF